jgi:hypothetical protein
MSDMNGESSPQGNEWHAKPNWMHWLKLGYVDAWQGTALAHDFDPVTYTEPLNTNQRAVNTTILPPDVRVKYKAARQFFNNKEVMPVGEFAMWAHTQGWNIPFEMTQFVKTGYVTPIEALPQQAQKQTTAKNEDFGILETAGLVVLAYETAKAKATINLQNSPRVNQMLNNLVNLRSQIATPAEAAPAEATTDTKTQSQKKVSRKSELIELMEKIYIQDNDQPNNNAMWNRLKKDNSGIIKTMEGNVIEWVSYRENVQKMQRTTFNNNMSKIRNLHK